MHTSVAWILVMARKADTDSKPIAANLLFLYSPPVGSVATEGVLSKGYMLACPDQVLHQNLQCPNLPYTKTWRKKHGDNFRAFYTASYDRISLPEA